MKLKKHVRFSDCIYIKIIDDPMSRRKTAIVDSAVFSIDITNDSDVFADNQLLLDTCACESVFRTATLFYDICGRTGYTGPTGRTGSRHDPPDPSANSTYTSLALLLASCS